MKLTKRTLRKLIKEEFKTAKLAEEDELPVDDDKEAGGEFTGAERNIVQQIDQRFQALANHPDVNLQQYYGQLDAWLQKIEKLVLGAEADPEKLTRTQVSRSKMTQQRRAALKDI